MMKEYQNKVYTTPQDLKNFIIGRVKNLKDIDNLTKIKEFIDKSKIR